jgi:tetratricopeptide (TPR) repeat protein
MKRNKRFWIITLLASLLLGSAAAYLGGRYAMRRRVRSWREQGIAASVAGEHDRAATLLGRYISQNPDDSTALRYYVTSRELVELPNGQHLTDTLAALKLLVGEAPNDLDARIHLLELYARIERRPEAVVTADAILAQTKDGNLADPHLRAKVIRTLEIKSDVLTQLLQFRDALVTVDRWLDLTPLDLKPHMARFSLRHRLQNPGDALVAEAEALRVSHADDPRFELLQGYAYALWADEERVDPQVQAERQAKAADWFKKAAAHKNPSDELVASLVEQFDNLGMSDDSMGTLQTMAKAGGSPAVHHTLGRRFWQLGRWQDAVAELADLNPSDPKSDATFIALKAIALANLGKKQEADDCRAALASRTNQAAARAWVLILRQIIDADHIDSKLLISECRSSFAGDPKNSFLAYYLGDAQVRLGDVDPAIQSWSYATFLNPTWAVPPARLVDALLQKGRTEEALSVAVAARRHNPKNPVSELAMARAAAAGIDLGAGIVDSDKLYQFATLVQSHMPGEDTTLTIQIDLLARQGKKEEAAGLIRADLGRSPAASQPLLLRLAVLSRHFGLGVEQDCLAACQKAHGISADLAYAQAIDRWMAGKPDEGLAAFDSLASRAAMATEPHWRLGRAKYLDAINSPAAKADWISLGDALPSELYIQQAAAKAQCLRGDWEFQTRTIDRLRALTGQSALEWQLVKARLMVLNPRTESDVEQGSVLLTDILKEYNGVPEPHVLLARALMQMKRTEGAIDHLSTAAKLEPYSVPIALQLAGLCQSKGDFDRARKEIDRVMPLIRTPEQRHAAATLLARQGNDDEALKILQQPQVSSSGKSGETPEDLLLASIYRQRRDNAKVDEVLQKLLKTPDVPTIEFAASFYASQDRKPDAQRALALLDGIKTEPGMKQMVWGRYYAGIGDLPAAAKQYQTATQLAPTNSAAWLALAVADARIGRMDDAVLAVKNGSTAISGDKSLASAESRSDLLKRAGSDQQLRPLAVLILQDPSNSDAAADVLRTLVEENQSYDVQRLASRLQQLIEKYPDFMPARIQLIRCLLSMNRASDALVAAQHAVTAFPNNPEPAELATRLCLSSGRWDQAAAAADTWKKRSVDNPLPADLAIAQAQTMRGQTDSALTQLQPYVQVAAADPDKYADLITLRCFALVRSGHLQEAEDTLWPLAQKSRAWRERFVQVSGQIPDLGQAVHWIDRLAEIVPRDASTERVMLAEVYDQLGMRLPDSKLTGLATEMYAELAADPKAAATVIVAAASHAERHGDPATAESLYRRALQLDSNLWKADNNLAMLIVNRGGDSREAAQFAAAAARLQPRQPAVLDTLADVQRKAGDLKAAAVSEKAAVLLDPDNVKWKIRFAQYLLDGGNVPDAQRVVQEIQTSGDGLSNLPKDDQQALSAQLTGIQKRLSGSKTL